MGVEVLEHIESYLDGKINRQELEQQVGQEAALNLDEKIEWFKRSKVAIEAVGLKEQLKEVLPINTKRETKVISIQKDYTSWYWAAASLIVLFIAFWGFYFNDQPSMYDKYLYVDPGLPVLMSQSNQYQLYDAMSYYSEGNYEVAAKKLQDLQKASSKSDTISYYLGASLLYQGKIKEAIPNLKEAQKITSSAFKAKADWLVVLANLKAEKTEDVKSTLSIILSNKEHPFYNEAIKLKSNLD